MFEMSPWLSDAATVGSSVQSQCFSNPTAPMLHFASALSGEEIATLNIEDVNGKPARMLKDQLASLTGRGYFWKIAATLMAMNCA